LRRLSAGDLDVEVDVQGKDEIARLGGDEFAVVIPATDKREALAVEAPARRR